MCFTKGHCHSLFLKFEMTDYCYKTCNNNTITNAIQHLRDVHVVNDFGLKVGTLNADVSLNTCAYQCLPLGQRP